MEKGKDSIDTGTLKQEKGKEKGKATYSIDKGTLRKEKGKEEGKGKRKGFSLKTY